MADKTLPNNVRELREAQLMSKAELARKAGLSPLTIDRVESGKPCRMDTKRKIILALGLKLTERHRVFPDDTESAKAGRARAGRAAREAPRADTETRTHAPKAAPETGRSAGRSATGDAARGADDEAAKAPKDEPAVGSDLPKARYS